MKIRICAYFFLFSVIIVTLSFAQDKTFNVGLKIIDFEYNTNSGDKEIITCAIWYPTQEAPQQFVYHSEKDYESRLAFNAPVSAESGPYPLIIFSHGAYGCGYNSAFFMEYLASRGYITAAADYIDTEPPDYTRQISFARIKGGKTGSSMRVLRMAGQFVKDVNADRQFLFSYLARHRLGHASFIIDEMLRLNYTPESPFYNSIKEDAIGAAGHSLGGLTILGKIGAHPDNRFKDSRIKAALIFSAPVYPLEDSIAGIDVPIMSMAGDNDEPAIGTEIPRRLLYDMAYPPKFYLILKDATHLSFGNGASYPQANAICRYGFAFFEKYLRRNPAAAEQLNKADSAWCYYIKEEEGKSIVWGEEPPPGEGGSGGIKEEVRKNIREKIRERIRERRGGGGFLRRQE